ncbi:MAG: hypothetical protein O3C57_08365, partial [Verrucomicrobia bacterium]|nr:hypothetical protein [Verrucomicrobiota bacterium]
RLAGAKGYVRPDTFPAPSSRGMASQLLTALRQILWKLTRWQSDAMAAQQNAINQQLAALLAFEKTEREREIRALKTRLEALERGKHLS